jgi:hypothetical protein
VDSPKLYELVGAGGSDGRTGQGDAAGEQRAGQVPGSALQFDLGHGHYVDQVRVGRVQDALFDLGELAFELLLLGAEFRAAFVDVADEVPVGIVDTFEVANSSLILASSSWRR